MLSKKELKKMNQKSLDNLIKNLKVKVVGIKNNNNKI